MTAAGVQTNDSAAYLPPPPSTSTPDAKGTTDPQAANAQGAPSDFQSELELQQSGPQQTESKASPKADSGKPGKKRDAQTDNANPSTVTPVQVTEPQRPILPLSLALPRAQELAQQQVDARPDQNIQVDAKATPADIVQDSAHQPAVVKQSAAPKESGKLRQPVPSADLLPTSTANVAPSAAPGSPKIQVLPLPVTVTVSKSEDSSTQDPASTSAKPGAPSGGPPVSPADLNLPATPASLVASGVQETLDRAPAGPASLAFAARMSAAQEKTDQPAATVPSLAVSGSQTAVEIPVRYAATAQIIQSATLKNEPGMQQDGSKKDAGPSMDTPARAGARTDMVLPQFETVSQSAANTGSTTPQQTAPPARAESVIEPPASTPASPNDIRVHVPDNNGGSTQVRFVESGGEVRVSVRTADEGLAQNLRTHLNDLTQRLSDGGMAAEIWKPANAASSQNDSQQQSQQDGRGSGGQGSGGQNGQQDRQQKRPAWLDEMEASLHGEQN